MTLSSTPIDGLTRLALEAQLSWVAKLKAIQAPDYIPVSTYSLRCVLRAEAPFLAVWMQRNAHTLAYGRTWRRDAALEAEFQLLYLEDWDATQRMTIGLGAPGAGLEQAARLHTGVLYDWFDDPQAYYPRQQVLLVARQDTQYVRGRWRLPPERAGGLPAELAFLRHGGCNGQVPLAAADAQNQA